MSDSSRQAAEALTDLQIEFTQWRSNKLSSRERIPEALLSKASNLSNQLDDRQVQKTLGITAKQWKRIQSIKEQESVEPPQTFVEVPNEGSTSAGQLDISISLPNGAIVSISGLKNQSVSAMVELILEGVC